MGRGLLHLTHLYFRPDASFFNMQYVCSGKYDIRSYWRNKALTSWHLTTGSIEERGTARKSYKKTPNSSISSQELVLSKLVSLCSLPPRTPNKHLFHRTTTA